MSLKNRNEVASADTWNLDVIYKTETDWLKEVETTSALIKSFSRFRGTLSQSADALKACVEEYLKINRIVEKIYHFAHLRADEDTTNSNNQGLMQRAMSLYAELTTATSYFSPELLAIPDSTLQSFMSSPALKPYARMIDELVRYKKHTLTDSEERLLALGTEFFMGPQGIFSQLNNADFNFGSIKENGEEKPLTHSSFSVFLRSENQAIREEAFKKHYKVYSEHKNALASILATSIRGDVFMARARKYPSAIEMSLFPDRVDAAVYNNLIGTVASNTGALARYYKLKAKTAKLNKLETYDMYISPVPDVKFHHTYEQASELILEALKPLGREYCEALHQGFFDGRWVDRYENKGKRSGAYSSGCYDTPPYMLMNFKEDSIDDVFTLAHEAGHSMHSYFSRKSQPYQDHGYPIITAEVASTFNEQLLFHHLLNKVSDKNQRLYLINQHLDTINGTLFRQTMYAEFEKMAHQKIEQGEPLTVDSFTGIWASLLEKYYGEGVTITQGAELGCFRIPHFYNAFYVYKYATGISSAITLADGVLANKPNATEKYLNFLNSGGSVPPIDTLKIAGVDLTSPTPIKRAIAEFETLLGELEAGLGVK